jgi:asparagine synthase (glutamine-hydrolysing)
MCGVAFVHDFSRPAEVLADAMTRALRRLHHRGPDEQAIQAFPAAMIGHARLSILDIATSQQPMSDPSGRHWLAFNGEIYNFASLRSELAQRWTFRTRGDTEVVLAGLLLEGPGFLQRMEGMWAIVLHDTHGGDVLLSRDRFGKKPLYFTHEGGGLACASELPALRELCHQPWPVSADHQADYFRYGFYMPGTTAWSTVHEVLPGQWMRWQPGKDTQSGRYWSPSRTASQLSHREACDQLRARMLDSIRKRMVADVEVGAFLSGGVDSSLVVSLLARELRQPVRTFTIRFDDPAFDESAHAARVAAWCGVDHLAEPFGETSAETLTRLIAEHVGQPFGDASLLPAARVSDVASQHVKVVLSGDGGDEIFCGYQRYQARLLIQWYTRLPATLRHLAARWLQRLPAPAVHHSRSLLKKAQLFIDAVQPWERGMPYVAPWLLPVAEWASVCPDLVDKGCRPPLIERCTDPLDDMMATDAAVHLPQDILQKVDRASMAHGLEVRSPFLDNGLAEFAWSLPREWHRRGLTGKRMLKAAFADELPADIWSRRKQGFAVPLSAWFREGLSDHTLALARSVNHPLHLPALQRLIQEHRSGRRDHGHFLWAVHTWLTWAASPAQGGPGLQL